MVSRSGAILIAIVILSFIVAFLVANLITPGGFNLGESLASFFSLPKVQGSGAECDCEYSSRLQDYICNTFCGDLSGQSCAQKTDCLI